MNKSKKLNRCIRTSVKRRGARFRAGYLQNIPPATSPICIWICRCNRTMYDTHRLIYCHFPISGLTLSRSSCAPRRCLPICLARRCFPIRFARRCCSSCPPRCPSARLPLCFRICLTLLLWSWWIPQLSPLNRPKNKKTKQQYHLPNASSRCSSSNSIYL